MEFKFSYDKFDPSYEEKLGTVLTLANGRIGVRGELELYKSRYGVFVSGVYDYSPVFYREIVNLPRVTGFYLIADSVPVGLEIGSVYVERVLDIGKGLVKSSVRICYKTVGCLNYSSIRMVHRSRKSLVGVKASVSVDSETRLAIISPLEQEISNPQVPDVVDIRHYMVEAQGIEENRIHSIVGTLDGKYRVAFAVDTIPLFGRYNLYPYKAGSDIGVVVEFEAKPGVTYEVLKLASITGSIEDRDVLEGALEDLDEAVKTGWETLVGEHAKSWESAWEKIDITIDGDEYMEKLLKFNAFHLLQLIDDDASEVAIPAKGLHGLGYRGHVFWDTEIYTLPFYILYNPKAARLILNYRCNRLGKALEYAKSLGYDGARFPWESADDGYEATPKVVQLDLAGKRKVRIWTGDEEEHITADIAYAIDYYYNATLDSDFMEKCGLRIIIETARYWASRVEYDELRDAYVIRRVMGPDEYHAHVDNSFYTNVMAGHNLRLAVRYYQLALNKPKWHAILAKLGVTEDEVEMWGMIADKIYIPRVDEGVYEEFEGYSKLEDYVKDDPDCIGEKCIPPEVMGRVEETRLIKQADVILAMLLLEDQFSLDELKENFNYYYPRTTHGSSLSLPAYALAAARIGYTNLAYKLLKKAASADIEDVYGNVEHGLHVASSGGVWLALTKGILNISFKDGDIIQGNPNLPHKWRKATLRLGWWSKTIMSSQAGDEPSPD